MRIIIDGESHEFEEGTLKVTEVLMKAGVAPSKFDLVFLGKNGTTTLSNGDTFRCNPGAVFVTAKLSAGTA